MTFSKRFFDVFSATGMLIILAPVFVIVSIVILVKDGWPIFYLSERMKTPTQGFKLIKFRTMRPEPGDNTASGGHKENRITETGRYLRRKRLDEIPQLLNVIKGDISLVGPRPPLRRYVEMCPEIYREVLKSRPGVTGLASVYFQAHETRLLAQSTSQEMTESIYVRRCVPRKARLDLLYPRYQSICFDMKIMLASVFRRLR